MENNSKLSQYKGQVDSLVTKIFIEYSNLENESSKTINSLKDDYNSMLKSNKSEHNSKVESLQADHGSKVESLQADHGSKVESLQAEHDSKVESLQAEHGSKVDTANKDNFTKDKLISELQKKVNSVTEETSENKFDIIRGQAKEIAAKDKEIIRLREELVKIKEDVLDKKHTGLSPTTSAIPAPLVVAENLEEKESVKAESNAESESESDEEYELITYRKTNYYLNKDKVYEIIKDDDDVGECVGDWVKQNSGKFKLVKH